MLPERLSRRLDAVLGSLAFTDQPGAAVAPESTVLLAIADAVNHHRPISIRYTAADGRMQRTHTAPARGRRPLGPVVRHGCGSHGRMRTGRFGWIASPG